MAKPDPNIQMAQMGQRFVPNKQTAPQDPRQQAVQRALQRRSPKGNGLPDPTDAAAQLLVMRGGR